MTAAAREVRGIVASAWTAERQRMHQLWFALGGLVVGILLWMVLPGLVARELAPTSWQWPEKLAARSLGVDSMWAGARRMAAVGSPDTWNMMIDGAGIERHPIRSVLGGNLPRRHRCGHPYMPGRLEGRFSGNALRIVPQTRPA